MNALLHLDRGEPEIARQRIEAAEALAAEQRIGLVLEPQILRGAVLIAEEKFNDAVGCLRDGLARPHAIRLRQYGLARLAEALSRQGKHEAALAAVTDGFEEQERTRQRRWAPELDRRAGIVLMAMNRLEEAEAALAKALRTAREQQAKSYELRAATTLARLWGEEGRRVQAHDLLAGIYDRFTEGFDTADLQEAKRLLDELR
jgi:predicted ATPase